MLSADKVHLRHLEQLGEDAAWCKMRCMIVQDTCYHCPFAHPGLCEALDINEYYSVCYEKNSFQFSPLSPPSERPAEGSSEWDIITGPRFDGAESPTYTLIVSE